MADLGILGDSNTSPLGSLAGALGQIAVSKTEDSPALHSALQVLTGNTQPSAATGELKATRTANVPQSDVAATEGQSFYQKNKVLIQIGVVLVVGLIALRFARR